MHDSSKSRLTVRHRSPAMCILCGVAPCHEELPVCGDCISILQESMTKKCRNCGRDAHLCDCSENEKSKFVMFYTDNVGSHYLVRFMKERGDGCGMDFVAELMIVASGIDPSEFDAVTFVPRTPRNRRRQGHDQGRELAKAVSARYGIEYIEPLVRLRGGEQKYLSYMARVKNMQNRIRLRADFSVEKKYKKLLLVDDIRTTGATIRACRAVLTGNVARAVVPVTVCRNNIKKKQN